MHANDCMHPREEKGNMLVTHQTPLVFRRWGLLRQRGMQQAKYLGKAATGSMVSSQQESQGTGRGESR